MIVLKKIDVVVLCGGLGTRLRASIGEVQKTMAKVDEEPFLNILLKSIHQQGFERVILCTGYQADSVEQYYRETDLGLEVCFSREHEPLGTGGAIKNAQGLIQSNHFIVLNGDSYCEIDFLSLLQFHEMKKGLVTVVVSLPSQEHIQEKGDYGSISLNNKKEITQFREKKQASDLKERQKEKYFVNAGIYCFQKEIFSLMPTENKFSVEYDFFPNLLNKKMYGFEVRNTFLDIGTPQRYDQAKEKLKDINDNT